MNLEYFIVPESKNATKELQVILKGNLRQHEWTFIATDGKTVIKIMTTID